MTLQTGYADVDGARLYYEIAGDGMPLVLVNGWDFDLRQWDAQVEPFTEQYRLIRWDARGYGKTQITDNEVNFSHAADLRALLDHLQIKQTALLALSWGGGLAVDFALEYPQCLSKLVLVAPAVKGYQWQSESILRYDEAFDTAWDAGDMARCAELDLLAWLVGPTRQPEQVDAALRERVKQWLEAAFSRPEGPQAVKLDPPAIGQLNEIRLPLLVIVGEHDFPDFKAIADRLVQAVPGAQKVIIDDTAHVSHMERPAEFNRIVLDFLAD